MLNLSVIIPVYNGSQFVAACIESVLSCGLPVDKFEIIIIDDGSTDNSLQIIKEIEVRHSNIYVVAQPNHGLGGARNSGIRCARGKFLLFLDCDDKITWQLPAVLEAAIELDLEIAEFGAQGIRSDGSTVFKFRIEGQIADGVNYYLTTRYMDSACNKLYSKNFLEFHNLRFLDKIYVEDFEFNSRCFFLAKRVKAFDLVAAEFHQTQNSITRNKSTLKQIKLYEDIIKVAESIRVFEKSQPSLNSREQIYFNTRIAFIITTLFYRLFVTKSSYSLMSSYRGITATKGLYITDCKILNEKKDIFNKIFLRNFWLFKITQIRP